MESSAEMVQFSYRAQRAALSMMPVYEQPSDMLKGTDSEEFKSEWREEKSTHAGDEENDDGDIGKLMLMLVDDSSAAPSLTERNRVAGDDLELGGNLPYLEIKVSDKTVSILRNEKEYSVLTA